MRSWTLSWPRLWRAGVGSTPADATAESAGHATLLAEEYVVALVRLAWIFVLRNDPRSKAAMGTGTACKDRFSAESRCPAIDLRA